MVDRRRFLAGLGALAIGSGALVESGAFSTVRGDRGVNVGTAADSNALLGLGGVSDAGTTPTFTNNSTVSMDVTLTSTDGSVEFDVGADDSFTDPATFSLNSGATEQVAIKGDGGTAPVTVTAELPSSSDPQATISLTRDYALKTQAGQIQLTPNVTATGNSGQYEFELKNTGSINVTLVGIGINGTSNPDAVEVAGGDILAAEGSPVLSTPIPVDSSTSGDTRVDFDQNQNVPLNTGDTKSFNFDKFRPSGNGNSGAQMKDESVTATFYFSDGSSKTLSLSPN
jgi:hypothetical protein